ncbi:MAG: hypothetical protein HY273_14490 [Gammaproteobacteria bacterium]|nr:hypothetical protein [Gammaproteobacteria bacterium]
MRYLIPLMCLVASPAFADSAEYSPPVFDLPLLDAHYNFSNGYTAPSMRQSLLWSKDVYQFAHHELAHEFSAKPGWRLASTIGFDIVMTWMPLGDSWLHEEWHRAVMGRRGIKSYNDVYNLPVFSDSIAVSHVTDAGLEQLKLNHPAEFVRLSAAGIEAQYEFNLALENDVFFTGVRNANGFLLWMNALNSIAYLDTCAGQDSDTLTAEFNRQDGTNVPKRDFTGLDCTAWVYDLHRPNEPYAQRGVHPSGVGIDRYISWSDLSGAERSYLRRQRDLSLLNLIDPFLFNHNSNTAMNPVDDSALRWNATLRHHLTSFGYSIDANLFLHTTQIDTVLIIHNYRNKRHAFPGISVELQRLPIRTFAIPFNMSITASLWQQPQQQRFDTNKGALGGRIAARFVYPLHTQWSTYIETDWKTAGWAAGNVYLDTNTSLRAGLLKRW